jgi:polyribonucleotide nucleotidyltransferase
VIEAIVGVGRPVPGLDFFPLSVDYEERFYAAGKISGSRFIKREGRPSEEAILAGRLIDRPIRPLFPKGYRDEVQVIAMVLSLDPELRPDIIAMIAASAALKLSGAPFDGPVAGVRIGVIDGKLKAYPTTQELAESKLDLTVAGTKDAIMMVEAGAQEVDEKTLVEAIKLAHTSFQPAIALQEQLIKKVGVKEREYDLFLPDEAVQKAVDKFVAGRLATRVAARPNEPKKSIV